MGRSGQGRSLKTARAVLRVHRLLLTAPRGVRPEEVAAHLGKSTATASYLLNSLCQEGYAVRDPADGRYRAPAEDEDPEPSPPAVLADAVDELYARTARRSYAVSGEGAAIVLREARGRQGLPKIAGLGERVQREAHAVAFGKVLLAFGGAPALATHAGAFGLTPFTPATITDPLRLAAELVGVRRLGFALDRQEFDPRFCCVSAPILAADGRPAGALALSVPAAHFADEGPALVEVVRQVAAQAGSA